MDRFHWYPRRYVTVTYPTMVLSTNSSSVQVTRQVAVTAVGVTVEVLLLARTRQGTGFCKGWSVGAMDVLCQINMVYILKLEECCPLLKVLCKVCQIAHSPEQQDRQ